MPDVRQGLMTPIQGLVARVTQAARYVISGVSPTTWFGPMQPLAPMAPPEVKGRQWDYPTGINLNYVPRSTEEISFGQLRMLAKNCDVLRGVIEARKDQVEALDWVIRVRETPVGTPNLWQQTSIPRAKAKTKGTTEDQQARINIITQFMQFPDKQYNFQQWQRALLEENFVIDAATIERRKTRGGQLFALDLIDGATIKPLLAEDGRRPPVPNPCYQQILHGIPAADFTADELLYMPQNVRVNHLYGYSRVEQVIVTVNTAIRRAYHQLDYYREGSQPDSFVGLPREWNLENVKDFQQWFDSLMSGNLGERRKVRFMPGEFKYVETKPIDLKDQYDEWLARIICFVFSIDVSPFVQHVNRAIGQQSKARALEEGLAPTCRWLKTGIYDRIISEDFQSPDLEFCYIDDREQDPSAQANQDVAYAKSAIMAINEIRQKRGLDPIPDPLYDLPMLATAQGYVPVGKLTSMYANGNGEQDNSDNSGAGNEDAPPEHDGQGVQQKRPDQMPPVEVQSAGHLTAN